MGSSLILLVIVGAWLVVLVPMALRSHEVRSSAAAERLHDAVRVLSRRHPEPADADAAGEATSSRRATVSRAALLRRVSAGQLLRRARQPVAPAVRRRRLFLGLAALVLLTAVGGLVGPSWLLIVSLLVGLLLVGLVVLARASVRRAQAARPARPLASRSAPVRRSVRRPAVSSEAAQAERVAARAAARAERARVAFAAEQQATSRRVVAPSHVAGIPSRMPSRPAGRDVFEVVAEAMGPQPPRGAKGEPWQPVPVPVPTYVTAPQAPRRRTRAAEPERVRAAEHDLGFHDDGPDLDAILDRRRASGDW